MSVCKVVHLTSAHLPFDTRIFYKECRTLAEAGYEVVLIAPCAKEEFADGVRIVPAPRAGGRWERMTRTPWRIFDLARREKAQIYHFHDPELLPVGVLLKLTGKKVIYDAHEDVPRQTLSKDWIPGLFRKPAGLIVEALENIVSRYFDAVVAATPFIHKRFVKICSRAINVNNYPDLNELLISNATREKKESLVCYVGGIDRAKGIFEMVGAIGGTEARLLLAGLFSSREERKIAGDLPGWKNVDELGYLGREGVKQVMARSMAGLVVLHPIINYVDALPVKMFEYMCAGIPVIASDFPLWREIVAGNECGICVNPLDTGEISRAIGRVLESPEECERMGKNGMKAVREKYNWQTEGEKLIELYQLKIFAARLTFSL